MIIGKNKEKVIANIRRAAQENRLNSKVEVDDPELSQEEQNTLIAKFLKMRKSIGYHFCNALARGVVDNVSRVVNAKSAFIGLEKLKEIKGGAVVTSNHFNPLDNTAVRVAVKKAGRRRLFIVSQVTNLAMKGWIGFMMNYTDIIPVYSKNRNYMTREFWRMIHGLLARKQWILIYPEQEMWFNYRKPRPPKRGAYYYAAKANVPVVSFFVEIVDRKERDTEQFHKVRYVVHTLSPIYPDPKLTVRENSIRMMKQDYEQKKQAYEAAYGKKLEYTFESEDIAGWIS